MKSCVFICGDDEFLVEQAGKRRFEQLTKDLSSDFSKEIIVATAANTSEVERVVEQFILSLQTLSLWEPRKVIWLKAVNFLSESPLGKAEGTKTQLEALTGALLRACWESASVVITAPGASRRSKEFKWLQAHTECVVINHDEGNLQALHAQAFDLCQSRGVQLQSAAWQALLERTQQTPRVIFQEIEKLMTYLGGATPPAGQLERGVRGGNIDEALVAELVPAFGEGDFFELSNAFFSLDLPRTLKALDKHCCLHTEGRPVLASLQNRNRLILQLRALIESNQLTMTPGGLHKQQWERLKAQATADEQSLKSNSLNLFSQNSWYVMKLAAIAIKRPLACWVRFQLAFIQAFRELLIHPHEQQRVLTNLTLQCLGNLGNS